MYSAVAIDLDGTTLKSDGTMSAVTQSVLAKLDNRGVHVVPATARPPRSTFDVTGVPTYAVCCNGALVVDRSGRTLWEQTFDAAKLVAVVSAALSAAPGLGFGIRSGDVIVGNGRYFELRERPVPDGSIEVSSADGLLGVKAHSLSFRSESAGSQELADFLGDRIPDDLGEISISAGDVLDVVPVGVSKAAGLDELGRYLGFRASDVVAYGDMPNDAAMLEWAGVGVSVSGAHPEAIAASDVAIGAPAEDSVAVHLSAIFDELISFDCGSVE